MMSDNDDKERLLRERKKNRKEFTRQNSHKHDRVPSSWRRARGTHSPVRKGEKHAKDSPSPGYGAPEAVRGLHPSGYEDVLVHRPDDLEELDADEQAARIASTVGGRKREAIMEKADDLDVVVLNHDRDQGEEQ